MYLNKDLLKKVNKESIQKGIFPSSIEWTPEEADQFLDYIVDQSVFKNNVRTIKMGKEKRNIRAVGLGESNVLWPEQNFDSDKYKSSLSHNRMQLDVKKARGAAMIHDDDLEDNIEGEAFVDHLMQMLSKEIANELEDAFFNGVRVPDNMDPQTILDIWDGWRRRLMTQSNAVTGSTPRLDARDSPFTNTTGYIVERSGSMPYEMEIKMAKMRKTLPSKYQKQGENALRFFMNGGIAADYSNAMATRATALGDRSITEGGLLHYEGIPIVKAPTMPTDLPVVNDNASTSLSSSASAGDTSLSVGSESGFDGKDIMIGSFDDTSEKWEAAIVDSTGTNTLNLKNSISYPHSNGVSVKTVDRDGADAILTHYQNLVLGLHRILKMETKRAPEDEATYFFYSIRGDVTVENPAAAVILNNLKSK